MERDSSFAMHRWAIEDLNARFAWLIDHQDGRGVSDLFTNAGVYDMSNNVFRGRKEIDGFYSARKSRGRRTARHVFTNLNLEPDGQRHASGNLILTLYAYDGEPPHPSVPILIADYDDRYRLCDDKAWRYESRVLRPIFGGVPLLTPKADAGLG